MMTIVDYQPDDGLGGARGIILALEWSAPAWVALWWAVR